MKCIRSKYYWILYYPNTSIKMLFDVDDYREAWISHKESFYQYRLPRNWLIGTMPRNWLIGTMVD